MRETIQTKLEELTSVESGRTIPDDIIVENTTYFGYELNTTFVDRDYDKNTTYRVNIIGYLSRLINPSENTQSIVDQATTDIIDKLKELNFRCNSQDVSIDNDILKVQITGYTIYNEIDNKFIV